MPTINDRNLIKELIRNNGFYLNTDDPQVKSIWRYRNDYRNITYAIFYREEHDMYLSPSVHDPILLWMSGLGITLAGSSFLLEKETT